MPASRCSGPGRVNASEATECRAAGAHGEPADGHGEKAGQLLKPIFDPQLPVRAAFAEQEGAPDASRNVGIDEMSVSDRHCCVFWVKPRDLPNSDNRIQCAMHAPVCP